MSGTQFTCKAARGLLGLLKAMMTLILPSTAHSCTRPITTSMKKRFTLILIGTSKHVNQVQILREILFKLQLAMPMRNVSREIDKEEFMTTEHERSTVRLANHIAEAIYASLKSLKSDKPVWQHDPHEFLPANVCCDYAGKRRLINRMFTEIGRILDLETYELVMPKTREELDDQMALPVMEQVERYRIVNGRLNALLEELEEYFSQRADADQPDDRNAPTPNEELVLLDMIIRFKDTREAIFKAKA
jgi:hypothetical protein